MMRKAYFGMYSLFLLGFHGVILLFQVFNLFPYFYTFFYPMFLLLSFLVGLVGAKEKDQVKWPAITGMILSVGLLIHWIVALILRLQG